MKLCIHCKYYANQNWPYVECTNDQNKEINMVNGQVSFRDEPKILRNRIDLCGPSAKWFEPLPEQEAA